MQTPPRQRPSPSSSVLPAMVPASDTGSAFHGYKVIRRNGAVVGFEPAKITIAMTKAFLAVNGGQGAASARVREKVDSLTDGRRGADEAQARAAARSTSRRSRTRSSSR